MLNVTLEAVRGINWSEAELENGEKSNDVNQEKMMRSELNSSDRNGINLGHYVGSRIDSPQRTVECSRRWKPPSFCFRP